MINQIGYPLNYGIMIAKGDFWLLCKKEVSDVGAL
jgi:hypothetical protein